MKNKGRLMYYVECKKKNSFVFFENSFLDRILRKYGSSYIKDCYTAYITYEK